MPEIKLANGTAIVDVRVWDGNRWVSRIIRIRTTNGWEDAHRPIYFSDNSSVVSNATRRSTTALISDGFRFNTNVNFEAFVPVGEFTNVELQGNPAIVGMPVNLEPYATYEFIVYVRAIGGLTNTGYGDYLILDLIGSGYDSGEQEFGIAPTEVSGDLKVFRKVFNSGNPPTDSSFRMFTFQQGGKYIIEKSYLIKR